MVAHLPKEARDPRSMFSIDSSKDPVSQSKSLKENNVNQGPRTLVCSQCSFRGKAQWVDLVEGSLLSPRNLYNHIRLSSSLSGYSFLSNSGFIVNSMIPFCLFISMMLS